MTSFTKIGKLNVYITNSFDWETPRKSGHIEWIDKGVFLLKGDDIPYGLEGRYLKHIKTAYPNAREFPALLS